MSEKIVVLGNGESRTKFQSQYIDYPIIGCNAAYRDINLDSVVCCDKKMVKEVLSNTDDLEIFTRPDWRNHFKNPRIKYLPDLPFRGLERKDQPIHWNSGPYAVLLACLSDFQEIYLLGFDLYSKDGLINNVYKDSENYKNSSSKSVDPSYWIYQIGKLFRHFEKKQFFIINNIDWKIPESWQLSNVSYLESVDL